MTYLAVAIRTILPTARYTFLSYTATFVRIYAPSPTNLQLMFTSNDDHVSESPLDVSQ